MSNSRKVGNGCGVVFIKNKVSAVCDIENIAIFIITEIFDSIKGNISTKYRQCYEHFDEIAKMGMKNGYSYKAHHPKHHDECSFSGMK